MQVTYPDLDVPAGSLNMTAHADVVGQVNAGMGRAVPVPVPAVIARRLGEVVGLAIRPPMEADRFAGSNVAGHTVAAMVCSHLTGTQPGSQYFGRGTAYRADLAAIKAWEESR